MTNDQMDLNALVGKSADGDFLRDMISFAGSDQEASMSDEHVERPDVEVIGAIFCAT